MKKLFKNPVAKLVLFIATFIGIWAYSATHRSEMISTGDFVFLYPNSTNTKTYQWNDAYQTNVFYTQYRPGLAVAVKANTDDTLTAQNHGFKNSDKVIFTADTAPTGLSVATEYFVISATASNFKVSTSDGGSAVDITAADDVALVAHSTNRKIIPQSTNSVTSAIEPSFAATVPAWSLSDGGVGIAAITVTTRASSVLTNAVTFKFQRSVNGTTFGTGANDTFSFDVTPSTTTTTLSTNVPSAFLQGASKIRLYQIVVGTNTTGTGNMAISGLHLGGYTQ